MKIIENLIISEGDIVFQPNIGNSYQLNNVAKRIIILMQQNKTKQEIVEIISSEYNLPKTALYIDISDFYSKLKCYGLMK